MNLKHNGPERNRHDGRDFLDVFRDTVLRNKLILISTVLIAVLSYGFTITNFSIGIDDPVSYHYLHTDGLLSMIQQGRLSHVVLEAITGSLTFIPFFNDFIGVALFVVSAWVLCAVFQYVTHDAFSAPALAVFSCIYLSFSIINEKFIYNLDVIVTMLSYLCFGLALLYAYQFVYEKRKNAFFKALCWLIVSISSYESFPFLYISGVLFLFMLKIYVNGEKITFKELLVKGLHFALILAAAMILYYGAVYVVQVATGQYGRFSHESAWDWSENRWDTLVLTLKNLKEAMSQTGYFPILIFNLASAAGFVLFAVWSVVKRNGWGLLCFAGMYLSNFVISFMSCEMLYRACQGFCFLVAAVVLCILYLLEKARGTKAIKLVRRTAYVLAILLVLLQAADLNRWFYNDYSRYKKEEFAVNAIATRLVAECDVSKPVVFANPDYDSYLYSNDGVNQTNGNSMVIWGIDAFYEIQSQSMIEIFKMHGFHFLQTPTLSQAEAGLRESQTMEAWPKKGSIQEFDDFIVVNFAEQETVKP